MFNHLLLSEFRDALKRNRLLVVQGSRGVGKTTLTGEVMGSLPGGYKWYNCGDLFIQQLWRDPVSNLKQLNQEEAGIMVLDDAHRIDNLDQKISSLLSALPRLQCVLLSDQPVINSLSICREAFSISMFDLLPPAFSFLEQAQPGQLPDREQLMIYGFYPKVISEKGQEINSLAELLDNLVYKDLVGAGGIKKPSVLSHLLYVLSKRLGQIISYNELATEIGIDKETIERYVIQLEESAVVFRLQAFPRRLNREATRNRKIFFYDNGLRNAIINDFRPLEVRDDREALWENFLLSERMKLRRSQGGGPMFFWRNAAQKEISFLEDTNGRMNAAIFQWDENKRLSFPKDFLKMNPVAQLMIVNKGNFRDFISNQYKEIQNEIKANINRKETRKEDNWNELDED